MDAAVRAAAGSACQRPTASAHFGQELRIPGPDRPAAHPREHPVAVERRRRDGCRRARKSGWGLWPVRPRGTREPRRVGPLASDGQLGPAPRREREREQPGLRWARQVVPTPLGASGRPDLRRASLAGTAPVETRAEQAGRGPLRAEQAERPPQVEQVTQADPMEQMEQVEQATLLSPAEQRWPPPGLRPRAGTREPGKADWRERTERMGRASSKGSGARPQPAGWGTEPAPSHPGFGQARPGFRPARRRWRVGWERPDPVSGSRERPQREWRPQQPRLARPGPLR